MKYTESCFVTDIYKAIKFIYLFLAVESVLFVCLLSEVALNAPIKVPTLFKIYVTDVFYNLCLLALLCIKYVLKHVVIEFRPLRCQKGH